MSEHPDYDNEYDDQSERCPKCNGARTVDCHCGGDFCVCENYGEMDCPVCHGEGVVSTERAERYYQNLRKHREALAAALKDTET